MNGRRSISSLLFALLLSGNSVSVEPAGFGPGLLANVAQVRALTVDQASQHPPAQLKGIVTLSTVDDVVLLDDTAGLYLAATNNILRQFRIGDILSVSGVVDPARFAGCSKWR